MQKRKLFIATIAALSVSISTTFGVMALNADLPKKEFTKKVVAEQTETKVEETVAVAEPAMDRIVGLKLSETKVSGDEGEKLTLKADANSNEKVKFTSSDNKVVTVSKKGVVSLKSKGTAKVVAEVEGEKKVCKVNVNEFVGNNIKRSKMAQIADEIGCQIDYAYPESTVMCSAYSFAYAYYQVKGTPITPGSVWTAGGCNWAGGTCHRCSSAEEMLSLIKSEIDKNRACVGLLSMGSAYTHYVTFYSYKNDGSTLSDYTVLDPWDATIVSAGESKFGYSGAGYDVITIN